MYRQYHLASEEMMTTGWLDTPARLRVGTRLTTKEHPGVIWTVLLAGRVELEEPPERKWHVGGLQ